MSQSSDQEKAYYISAEHLLFEYRHFIDSHESLSKLNNAYVVWPDMVALCEELESFPDLMRAITSLHSNSQIDFERALFCSWLSLVLARSLNLAQAHQRSLFLAGLLQDLGKHSVGEEVKAVLPAFAGNHNDSQCHSDLHPMISSTFVERILDDQSVSELILHHHARYDGTGYPQHLSESQLDLDHQILIIANEISDQLDVLGGHNQLEVCLPVLRVNSFMYFNKTYAAWYELLSKHFEFRSEFESLTRAKYVLQARKQHFEKLLACLISLSGELLRYDFNLHVHGLRTIIQKLAHMFADMGVLTTDILSEDEVSPELIQEIDLTFKGTSLVLERCKEFINALQQSGQFEVNGTTLGEALRLLNTCISDTGSQRASIFR